MDPLLFGHQAREHIVAVHPASDSVMRVYVRDGENVSHIDENFFPYFFISDSAYLADLSIGHWVKELEGPNFFRYACAFRRWPDMWDAIKHVFDMYNRTTEPKAPSFVELPVIHFRNDPVAQFLIQSGNTLFKGLLATDLHRMQIEVVWSPDLTKHLQDTRRLEKEKIVIVLQDNRGWDIALDSHKSDFKKVLEEFCNLVRERDPDILEGHNLQSHHLPQFYRLADQLGVLLPLGRDGSTLEVHESRAPILAGDSVSYRIAGRHIVDTALLLQHFDDSRRRLEGTDLTHSAAYFGLRSVSDSGIHQEKSGITKEQSSDALVERALTRTRMVRQLTDILLPAHISLAQMIPFDLDGVIRSGPISKIEAMMERSYLHNRHSLPLPSPGVQSTGGRTELFHRGVFGPVLHLDVASTYRSIIVSEEIVPSSDLLCIFPDMLKGLLEVMNSMEKQIQSGDNPQDRHEREATLSAMKTLANAFFSYLASERAHFNDYRQADRAALSGQRIIDGLIRTIHERGGKVLEIDADGIYFQPPTRISDQEQAKGFVDEIATTLPEGIQTDVSRYFDRMFCYKLKNHALLDAEGKMILEGTSLISRSLEPFARRYVKSCTECLLRNDIAELHKLYLATSKDISEHKIGIREFVRTETLVESAMEYEKAVEDNRRNRSASYEAALRAGILWKRGTKVSYYITGTQSDLVAAQNSKLMEQWDEHFPDQNVAYYLRRLDELSKRFEDFFLPQDYQRIFSADELFEFSYRGIHILNSAMISGPESSKIETEEGGAQDISIWLDES